MIDLVTSTLPEDGILFLDTSAFSTRTQKPEIANYTVDILLNRISRLQDIEGLVHKRNIIVTKEVREELRDCIGVLHDKYRIGFFGKASKPVVLNYIAKLKGFLVKLWEIDPRRKDFRHTNIPHVDRNSRRYQETLERLLPISHRLHEEKARLYSLSHSRNHRKTDACNVTLSYVLNKQHDLLTGLLADDKDMLTLALSLEEGSDWKCLGDHGKEAILAYAPSGFQMLLINPNWSKN